MFHRHFDDHVRHSHGHGGFGHGPFHHWRSRGSSHGDREGRMFDGGELRLAILALVAEKPRYGYEIIKELGERVGGDYSPSPGVVYPTLTMLEEEGYATVASTESSKKLYTITERGAEYLDANRRAIDAILGRMVHAGKAFGRGKSPQIMRAIANLKFALKMRTGRSSLSSEQIRKIAEAIDAAARSIDEV